MQLDARRRENPIVPTLHFVVKVRLMPENSIGWQKRLRPIGSLLLELLRLAVPQCKLETNRSKRKPEYVMEQKKAPIKYQRPSSGKKKGAARV